MSRLRCAARLVSLATLACASSGGGLPEERVAEIRPGLTTQEQIRDWFGAPDSVEVDAFGAALWSYDRDLTGPPRRGAGRWVAPLTRFLGETLLYPPSMPTPRRTLRDDFEVCFHDGVVRDFSYSRDASER